MKSRIQELAQTFVRMQKEAENEMSLDPQPALQSLEQKEKPVKKRVRRVFPFRRYINS
jgi:hypothetical protein